uniref:Uncharacterized protein n=1 Tax=Meloidogyne enterolobii TaxID=390850 RepID=A0A6V7V216_MELEN|nr:unnamed protein product [Meloidogyne enterolobii]
MIVVGSFNLISLQSNFPIFFLSFFIFFPTLPLPFPSLPFSSPSILFSFFHIYLFYILSFFPFHLPQVKLIHHFLSNLPFFKNK